MPVPNPAYDGTTGTPATIPRDYGFGATQGTRDPRRHPAHHRRGWNNASISATIPAGTANGTYQLMVTRGDNGATTKTGLTVTDRRGGSPCRVAAGGGYRSRPPSTPRPTAARR